MTFKAWINSLPLPHLMVLARQVGFKAWKAADRRQISSFLIKSSPETKELFTKEKLGEIKVSAEPDFVA